MWTKPYFKVKILRPKCTKFDFGCGSAPDPTGELTALRQTPYLDLSRPTSKGRGRGRKRERGGENWQGDVSNY